MEKFFILAVIALTVVASDMDPKCFVKPPYVNPRTCCLDPTIVRDDLHEKCMRKVFKPHREPEIDVKHDQSETNLNPNRDDDNNVIVNNDRKKRSVDELPSSLDDSNQKEFDNSDDNESENENSNSDSSDSSGDSLSESSNEKRQNKNHRHRGRHHRPNHNRHHRRHHNGKHNHGRHHHGKHHGGHHPHHHQHHHHHHHGGHNSFENENPNEYDDTYAPVFHRDFARWNSVSARFQKLSIYWNCVFNETGIIDPYHRVIMPNVKSYLNQVLDDNNPFLPIMEDAFNTCRIKGEEFAEGLKEAKEHYILDSTPLERQLYRKDHPQLSLNTNTYNKTNYAYFLIRCVKRVTYKNCPDEKFRVDDKLCNKSRAYLKNCPYSARHYYQKN